MFPSLGRIRAYLHFAHRIPPPTLSSPPHPAIDLASQWPTVQWDQIFALCQRIGPASQATIQCGVEYIAVRKAHAHAKASGETRGLGDRAINENFLLNKLRGKGAVLGMPGWREIGPHLEGVFRIMESAIENANAASKHLWSSGGSSAPNAGSGEAAMRAAWKEAELTRHRLLQAFHALGSRNPILDLVEPLKHKYHIDAKTLNEMGLNANANNPEAKSAFTELGSGGRRRERGMPLERMGYRQRLRYAGAY
ncbi:hypothetical protein JCM11251_000884 [Rhodosporidiobolus azoricus]